MEFKGTKGNWKSFILDISDFKQVCVGKDKGKAICHLWFEFDEGITDEVKANAKLISCAPEMLEMLDIINKSFGGGRVITFSDKDIEDIGNLIKKATE